MIKNEKQFLQLHGEKVVMLILVKGCCDSHHFAAPLLPSSTLPQKHNSTISLVKTAAEFKPLLPKQCDRVRVHSHRLIVCVTTDVLGGLCFLDVTLAVIPVI